ncbi:fumarate hydratase [Erythrobacter sp. SD-21]|nr:fumarate hydratase [Erythrobacter sp. SD-21]
MDDGRHLATILAGYPADRVANRGLVGYVESEDVSLAFFLVPVQSDDAKVPLQRIA